MTTIIPIPKKLWDKLTQTAYFRTAGGEVSCKKLGIVEFQLDEGLSTEEFAIKAECDENTSNQDDEGVYGLLGMDVLRHLIVIMQGGVLTIAKRGESVILSY